jgi:hypothetical protein
MATSIPGQQSTSELLQTKASESDAQESSTLNENPSPDISTPVITLQVHPWRSALYEELHNRPSPIIEGVCQITHFTVMFGDAKQAVYEHVVDL